MNRLHQDIDELDRMVDTDAPKDAIRSQIRLIGREVAALETDYASLSEQHAQLQAAQAPPIADPPLEHRRGLYYAASDPIPFCPHCWEAWHRRIHLSGPVPLFDSAMERWDCYTCQTTYAAKPDENFLPNPRKT
jgi:hypothetical protein